MRVPTEAPRRQRTQRPGLWILLGIAFLIVLIVVVQGLAGFYANFLWFHSSGVGVVWRTVIETKVVLAAVFVVIAFFLFWGCLFLVDKVAPRALFMAPDTDLVRRYQAAVGPHAFAYRTAVSLVVALAVGSGASGQWQHWLLFEHAVAFRGAGSTDPIFHRNLSFFVFRFPFLSFLVDWILIALIFAFVLTTISYFLNGAIRLQGNPRIEPQALGHLSALGGLMALERAWAYYYVDRYGLDLSHNGVVAGASYTDVHVRLPAMTLLAIVSLVAFVMFVFNAYQRSVVLPVIAFGLWAFLAIVLGVIYPAIIQTFRVTPAQSTLERPYITDNIAGTQRAYGITNVPLKQFPVNQDLTPGVLARYSQTFADTNIWDPLFTTPTFQKLQNTRGYYTLTNLAIDRYPINGDLEPVIVGVREVNTSALPNQSWVNTRLQYTHGFGALVAYANGATSAGNPQFVLGSIPPVSTSPSLALTQPSVYFAPGDEQYVIADTRQPEVDYPTQSTQAANVTSHYSGNGGIPIGSFAARIAFTIHLHDFNLLVSNLITSHSRLIYIPDVRTMVQKSLPFLSIDSNPYAVIDHGEIDWIVDAYTTSSYYPYSQTVSTGALSSSSGLNGSYNYVRDALKVVVNAYTGKMSFYAINPSNDPIIRSYENAFPGLIKPLSSLAATDPTLLGHLRYPQDLLTVQAAMYGRYHVAASNEATFYSNSQAWDLSQVSTSPTGSPSAATATSLSGTSARYTPVYQLIQLPDQASPTFNLIEPLVPQSANDQLRTLSALLVADSSAANYGQLQAFVTTRGGIEGPSLVNAAINSDAAISKQITLLDSGGSTALLGTVMELPIADSLIYIRPLYVSSSQTDFPQLQDVIAVYGNEISMEPTLNQALAGVFGTSSTPSSTPSSSSSTPSSSAAVSSEVRTLVSEALADYDAAQSALGSADLGAYQEDVAKAGELLDQANKDLAGSVSASLPATHVKSTKATNATNAATPNAALGANSGSVANS